VNGFNKGISLQRKNLLPTAQQVARLRNQRDDFGRPLTFEIIARRLGATESLVRRLARLEISSPTPIPKDIGLHY